MFVIPASLRLEKIIYSCFVLCKSFFASAEQSFTAERCLALLHPELLGPSGLSSWQRPGVEIVWRHLRHSLDDGHQQRGWPFLPAIRYRRSYLPNRFCKQVGAAWQPCHEALPFEIVKLVACLSRLKCSMLSLWLSVVFRLEQPVRLRKLPAVALAWL